MLSKYKKIKNLALGPTGCSRERVATPRSRSIRIVGHHQFVHNLGNDVETSLRRNLGDSVAEG